MHRLVWAVSIQNLSAQAVIAGVKAWRAWWPSLSLVRQFTLAAGVLVLLAVGLLVLRTSGQAEVGIQAHRGARTGLYMEGVIAPHLQGLAVRPALTEENVTALDLLLGKDLGPLGVVAAKIWARDGTIVYATLKEEVGRKFQMTAPLNRAWDGYIEVQFTAGHVLHDGGPTGSRDDSLLEIYVPIRDATTHDIIAVAEFYEIATGLKREQERAHLAGLFISIFIGVVATAGLYSIVANGNRTIETQRISLASRITQLSDLLQQNEELRQRVQTASQRSTEGAELHLRRLGADLHDGPAQLLALALLRLDKLPAGDASCPDGREVIRRVLSDAMSEIRDISAGLALPEIEKLSLPQALVIVVAEHERRTSTRVSCEFDIKSTIQLSHPSKLCLCRFAQEGLSNAFRHAGGVGQKLTASWTDTMIVVEVSDEGPGLYPAPSRGKRPALGLVGLRNRVESLGGRLTITSNAGNGTRLTACLPVSAQRGII
jgi:signal transduction histidine kinase